MKKSAENQAALDDVVDTAKPESESESEFNLAEYVGMVRRHWRLVAAACVISLAAGAIHYAITPKAYMATSIIQIERRTLAPTLNSQAPWLESYFDAEYYPTQYALLESRGLAERVVKRLDLAADPTWNPGHSAAASTPLPPLPPPAGTGAAASAAALADHRQTTVDDDLSVLGGLAEHLRSGLAIEPVRNTQLVEISYRAASPLFAARAANAFADSFIDMGIEYRFASAGKTSSFLGSQIVTMQKQIQEKEAKLQAYSRRTDIVTMDPQSNVTIQRMQSLNTSYMEAKNQRIDKEATYRELMNAGDSVADTLQPGVIGSLRADELRLERDYDTKLKTYKPDWPAMLQLKGEIEKSKQHVASVVAEMVSNARKNAYNAYATALAQEQTLESEIGKVKSQALNQNQEAVEYNRLTSEIKAARDTLDELEHKQQENEVQARLQDTRDSNVHIVDRAMVPGGPFYPSLRKDVSYGLLFGLLFGVGAALLIEFLDRTIKTADELERRLNLPTLAVIQDIVDAGRSYGYAERYGYGYYQEGGAAPAPAPIATASAAGGAAGGGSAAKGRAVWSGRGAKTAAATGAPAAQAQPADASPAPAVAAAAGQRRRGAANTPSQIELVPHELPRTQISEAYRSLRTALLLSSARTLKVVAVTSAAAGEGKTATATNLAIVLAQLGRPVLIVDADLRKPRLHQVFRISNQAGLVSYLAGNLNASEVVQRSAVPHLWIVPSGPIAPNPSELLSSDRMKEWLNSVRSQFEYIIIDTPPALAVTDATIVGVMADGVVMTLRSGKVTREEARQCRDRLRQADVRILGAVLNRYRSAHSGLGKRYRAYESYVAAEQPAAPKAGSAA